MGCSSSARRRKPGTLGPEHWAGTRRIYFLYALTARIITIPRKTLGEFNADWGNWWAVNRTAERAEFMFDNYTTMPSYGRLLAEKFPNSKEAYYLKQAQQYRGS
jgi:hypothetical protein